MTLELRAFFAGVFFGAWPLFMNRSGLNGNVSSVVFGLVSLICVLPFAIQSGSATIWTANWTMAALAGISGGIGLLFFNSILANTTPETVSTYFVLTNVVVASVPAIYQTYMTGLTTTRMCGFAAAILAAVLLTKK